MVIYIFIILHFLGKKMALRRSFSLALMVLCISMACIVASKLPSKGELENAFKDRAQIEKMIQCFVGKKTCTPAEDLIKSKYAHSVLQIYHSLNHNKLHIIEIWFYTLFYASQHNNESCSPNQFIAVEKYRLY